MSQGLPSGSFCLWRDCKAVRDLGTRAHNRLAVASSSEHSIVNLLRGCEHLGVKHFCAFRCKFALVSGFSCFQAVYGPSEGYK